MTDYRPIFRTALSAKAQPLGRRLTPEEILEVAQVVTEGIVAEARKRAPKKAQETDAEWLSSLEADPALKELNVRREIERCALWYHQNVSKTGKPSRRRITNWLLKAEKVVDLKAMGAQHANGLKVPAPDGPPHWLEWLTTELSLISEDHQAHGQLLFALNSRHFSALPASWQARCNSQLRQA